MSKQQSIQRIAANFSFMLAESNVGVRELARELKLPVTTIHNLKIGASDARVSLVARIAEHFGIAVDDLLLPKTTFSKKFKNLLAVAG